MKLLARTKHAILQNTPNFLLQPIMKRWKASLLKDLVGANPEAVFTDYYKTHHWPGESVSGVGSQMNMTINVRAALPHIIDEYGIKSLLDAPCGDFHWMQHVKLGDCEYIGADIVRELIEENQKRYTSDKRAFRHVDITTDALPATDLVLCRDCLIHLPFDMALSAIRNFKKAGIKFLLTTTFPTKKRHWDTPAGGFHWINMRLAPFKFPPPLQTISEESAAFAAAPALADRSLGLWRLSDIKC